MDDSRRALPNPPFRRADDMGHVRYSRCGSCYSDEFDVGSTNPQKPAMAKRAFVAARSADLARRNCDRLRTPLLMCERGVEKGSAFRLCF